MTKKMKRLFALLMTVILAAAFSAPAFADEGYSITVKNTPSSTNVSIVGELFSAYKIFDVTYTAGEKGPHDSYAYTIKSGSSWFQVVKDYLGESVKENDGGVYTGNGITLTPTAPDNTVYNVEVDYKENEDGTTTGAFHVRDFADYLGSRMNGEGAGPDADGTGKGENGPDSGEQAVISLTEPGYYLVTSQGHTNGKDDKTVTVVAAAALNTAEPAAELNLKADAPAIDKKIETDGGLATASNAAVGEQIKYEIKSEVPDMSGYKNYFFVVSDTLSGGLTFNGDVEIKMNGSTLVEEKDYTVTSTNDNKTGETAIKIVFKNFIGYKDKAGKDIVITYSAAVNENAVIGVEGNPNRVTLTYSSNPNVETEGDEPGENDPTGTTPESEVRTYVTGIRIHKTDDSDPAQPLKGAAFRIEGTALKTVLVSEETFAESETGNYWKLKNGSYTTQDPAAGDRNQEKYESTEKKYEKTVTYRKKTKETGVSYEGSVGDDGVLCLNGLSAGKYTVTEIKAPDGYNLLTAPLQLNIGWTAPAGGSTNCTWYKESGSEEEWSDGTDGIFAISVVNKKGSLLPETGGTGTFVFYAGGGILMAGALGLILFKKKKF